jgi:hypothetical protein
MFMRSFGWPSAMLSLRARRRIMLDRNPDASVATILYWLRLAARLGKGHADLSIPHKWSLCVSGPVSRATSDANSELALPLPTRMM